MKSTILLFSAVMLLAVMSACKLSGKPPGTGLPNVSHVVETRPSAAQSPDGNKLNPNTEIVFSDPVVEMMVRYSLGYSVFQEKAAVTIGDATTLEELGCRDAEYGGQLFFNPDGEAISSLEDLKWFPNLKRLYLNNCGLTSLDGIETLEHLEVLGFKNNSVSDLTPVAGLENLNRLLCPNNKIIDLTPLAGLEQLTEINLYNNSVADTAPLAQLTMLEALCLTGNPAAFSGWSVSENRYAVSEITATVNPLLPEFVFQAITYENNSGRISTEYLKVIDSQGNAINDFELWGLFSEACNGISVDDDRIEFIDMNFDGYMDFRIHDVNNGNSGGYYLYFMWDKDNNRFTDETPFSGDFYRFDTAEQLVYSATKGSARDHRIYTYKYMEGELTCIEILSDNAVFFPDGVTDRHIYEITGLTGIDIINDFQYVVIEALNPETMRMEVIEEKFVSSAAEFDSDSPIGKKLAELVDRQVRDSKQALRHHTQFT